MRASVFVLIVLILPLAVGARVDPAEYLKNYVYSAGTEWNAPQDVENMGKIENSLVNTGEYVDIGNNTVVDKNMLNVLEHIRTDENVPMDVIEALKNMNLNEDIIYKDGKIYKAPGSKLPVGEELQNFYRIVRKYPRLIDTIRELGNTVVGEDFVVSDNAPVEPAVDWKDFIGKLEESGTLDKVEPEQIEAAAKILQQEQTREIIKKAAELSSNPRTREAVKRAVELAKKVRFTDIPRQDFSGAIPQLQIPEMSAPTLPDVGGGVSTAVSGVFLIILAFLLTSAVGVGAYVVKKGLASRRREINDPVAAEFWMLMREVQRKTGERIHPWETLREYMAKVESRIDEEVKRAIYGFEKYVYAREKPLGLLGWIRHVLQRIAGGIKRIIPVLILILVLGEAHAQTLPLVTTYSELVRTEGPKIIALEPETEDALNEYVLVKYGIRNTKLPAMSPEGHPIFPVEVKIDGIPSFYVYYNVPTCLVPERPLRGIYSTFRARVNGRERECIAYFFDSENGILVTPDVDAFSEDMIRYFTANALANNLLGYALGLYGSLMDAYINSLFNRMLATVIPIVATALALAAIFLGLMSALSSGFGVKSLGSSELPKKLLPVEPKRKEKIEEIAPISELRRALLKRYVERARIPVEEKYRLMEGLNRWGHISKIRALAVRVKIWLTEIRYGG